MAKFNPALLVPAAQVAEFSKDAKRSVKDTLLNNIAKMKEQWQAGDAAQGKRNYEVAGDRVKFTLRVSNSALVLGTFQDGDKTSEVREMTVPKANLLEALDYYADRVKAGEFDAQLLTLDGKKEQRTSKMRETRKAKKEAAPAK